MTDGDLARIAHAEIDAHARDGIDERHAEDEHLIARQHRGGEHQSAHHDHDERGARSFRPAGEHRHTRRVCGVPSMPAGRKMSTTSSTPNVTTSLNALEMYTPARFSSTPSRKPPTTEPTRLL